MLSTMPKPRILGGTAKGRELETPPSGTRPSPSRLREALFDVLAFEPLKLLSYSWSHVGEPERPLRWELEAVGSDTRLVLTVGIPAGEDAAKACAGFEGHLEMLAAALEGVPIKFPFDLFLAARAAYRAQLER